MKRFDPVRSTLAVAGLGMARTAAAAEGGISSTGWWSMGAMLVITLALLWVYKKTN